MRSLRFGKQCFPGVGKRLRLRLFPVGLHILPLRLPVEFLLERLQFLRHMGKPLLPVRELGLGLELE